MLVPSRLGLSAARALAGRLDRLPLAVDEVLRRFLHPARLRDADTGAVREPLFVFARDRLGAVVAGLDEELDGAIADAADQREPLAIRDRVGPRLGRGDALLSLGLERLHRVLLHAAGGRLVAEAGDRAELLDGGIGDLF